jgi:hypothetical protein
MDQVTRRDALKLAAAGGTAATGMAMFAGQTGLAQEAAGGGGLVEPTREERASWQEFTAERAKKGKGIKEIPIPYGFTIGAVTITGVFHLREPVESSSTDGVVVGAINGTYHLDKDHTGAKFYDPTGNILRLEIELDFGGKTLKARLCHRNWDGSWKCSGWVTLASW